MDRNHEDKLMDLAFGELNPKEAARLQARVEADPLSARELALTRQMREDLLALAEDVPPDQLSKERLRHAILGNGLHPAPMRRSMGLGWLWAPAAAFAAAFVLVFLRSQPAEPEYVQRSERSEPGRVIGVRPGQVASRGASRTLGLESFAAGPAALSGYIEANPTPERPARVTNVVEERSRRALGLIEETTAPSEDDGARNVSANPEAAPLVDQPRGRRPMGSAPDVEAGDLAHKEPVGNTADSTIVVIGQNQNNATGAQTATEMEKENVLVGG